MKSIEKQSDVAFTVDPSDMPLSKKDFASLTMLLNWSSSNQQILLVRQSSWTRLVSTKGSAAAA